MVTRVGANGAAFGVTWRRTLDRKLARSLTRAPGLRKQA
jgi:hypothetical protein